MPSGILGSLNRLLPFATPGTPPVQDLIHLVAVCLLLYFAPQIQEYLRGPRDILQTQPEQEATDLVATQDEDNHEDMRNEAPAAEPFLGGGEPDAAAAPLREAVRDEQLLQDDILEGQPGPAHVPNTAANRNVGAKKAKSLARRDQRRAYHEFVRSQGDAERARDAEGAAERDAALTAERERRRAAEAALDAKKAKERDERKAKEEQDRADKLRRREFAVGIVRDELAARNMCDLFRVPEKVGGDVDEIWVENMLNAAGVLGKKGDTLTMITSMGWVVRVTEQQMANLYITAAEDGMGGADGRIEMEDLGAVLETMLRA